MLRAEPELAAVIFDFDGIIVDTEPMHYRAFMRVLEPLELGYSWESYLEEYIGFDDRDAFREVYARHGRSLSTSELETLIAAKAAAFQEVIANGVTPYPGVVELLDDLNGRIPLALCSGALRSDIIPIVTRLGIRGAFDVMVTADDVAASKPDPESYRLAHELLQQSYAGREIPQSQTLAIEDTPAGITSARRAGLKVLAVTNSYPADRLKGGATVVDSLQGLNRQRLAAFLRD
ncbi:MAG TPA: HAD family phosphatase [Geobacterales bacterium]|nr:HAD family phosphatase [Geobacterales bacterium]